MPHDSSASTLLPTFAVIDAENLDRARIHSGLTPGLGAAWRSIIPTHSLVTTVAGADGSRFRALEREFTSAHLVTGHGPDGGELALIDAIERHALDGSYGCLVIGSGDHEFVGVAGRARAMGLLVVVVALDDSLSTALVRTAHHTIGFPPSVGSRPTTTSGGIESLRLAA